MMNKDAVWEMLTYQATRELQQPQGVMHNLQERTVPAMVRLANLILSTAIERRASDIHLEPQADALRIRYRVDGLLQEEPHRLARNLAPGLLSRLKVMAGMDIAQRQKPQDGHLRYTWQGTTVDVRAASMPGIYGEMMVLRLLNVEKQNFSLQNLAFRPENYAQLQKLLHRPSGLVVVCGPMNSGKSTTLYAALQELNRAERNIITLEDPVERQIAGIQQVQMNPKAGLDYVTGLRAILRQDAECILLGEIRDSKTAAMAVRIALTGHLLLTTLHTEDSLSAIYRFLEMGIEPYLLAATLTGILAQRLVRRLCLHCKEKFVVQENSREAVLLGDAWQEGMTLYRATGCEACQGTGYQGRLAVQELLTIDADLREAILRRASKQELRGLAQKAGMQTLWQDGLQKVVQGETTLSELRRVIYG